MGYHIIEEAIRKEVGVKMHFYNLDSNSIVQLRTYSGVESKFDN